METSRRSRRHIRGQVSVHFKEGGEAVCSMDQALRFVAAFEGRAYIVDLRTGRRLEHAEADVLTQIRSRHIRAAA